MYMQARSNGMGEIDWGGILKDAVGGYVAYKTVDTQADLAKSQLQAQQAQQAQQAEAARQASLMYSLSPQYSPQYGTGQSQGIDMTMIMLLGGAALVLFILMKD